MRHLDPCTDCDAGTMRRYSTKTKGHHRRRYLKCDCCGHPGQEVFRVDELGRPVFSTSFTPSGKHSLEFHESVHTMNKAK